MNYRIILLFTAAFLSAHLSALACEPRSRAQVRVEGTVTAVQQDRIEISMGRRPDALLLTERTRILQGESDVDASVLKPGDRVLVHGVRVRSGQIEAREVRIADRAQNAPLGNAPASGGHKH